MDYYNGLQSTTSICVVVRSTVDGDCTLTAGGKTDTAAAATATHDGWVRLEISGLAADTVYSYTVTNANGETGSGSVRTFPTSGQCPIAVWGCQQTGASIALAQIHKQGCYASVHLGDETYEENDIFGGQDQGYFEDVANHYTLLRNARTEGDKRHWLRQMGFCWVTDDHDAGLNDVTDHLATVQSKQTAQGWSFTTPDQSGWDAARAAILSANAAYSLGNPINTDSEAATGARYFRFEAGDAEYFVLSAVVWDDANMRGQHSTTATKYGTLYGDDQIAWLKARLAASAKALKIICAPKATLYNRDVNEDSSRSYDAYPLFDWVSSNVTGVLWAVNDHHAVGLYTSRAGVDGVTDYTPNNDSANVAYDFDHVAILGGPSGKSGDMRSSDHSGVGSPKSGVKFWLDHNVNRRVTLVDTNKYTNAWYQSFTVVDTPTINGDQYARGHVIGLHGGLIVQAHVKAGTNYLSYPAQRVA